MGGRDTCSSFIIIGVFIIIPLFIKVLRDMGGERGGVKPEECREGERGHVSDRKSMQQMTVKKEDFGQRKQMEERKFMDK